MFKHQRSFPMELMPFTSKVTPSRCDRPLCSQGVQLECAQGTRNLCRIDFQICTVNGWTSTNHFPRVGIFFLGETAKRIFWHYISRYQIRVGMRLCAELHALLYFKAWSPFFGSHIFPQDPIVKLKTAEEASPRTAGDWWSPEQMKTGITVSCDYKSSC